MKIMDNELVCGGIISLSKHLENVQNNRIDYLAFVMPDDKYKLYLDLLNGHFIEQAKKIFKENALSFI